MLAHADRLYMISYISANPGDLHRDDVEDFFKSFAITGAPAAAKL